MNLCECLWTSLARLARTYVNCFCHDRKVCKALSLPRAPLWGREEKIMRQSWQHWWWCRCFLREMTHQHRGWTWGSCHGALTKNNWGYLRGLGDTSLLIWVFLIHQQAENLGQSSQRKYSLGGFQTLSLHKTHAHPSLDLYFVNHKKIVMRHLYWIHD